MVVGVSALRLIQDRGWSATGLKTGHWPWLALTTLVGGIIAHTHEHAHGWLHHRLRIFPIFITGMVTITAERKVS